MLPSSPRLTSKHLGYQTSFFNEGNSGDRFLASSLIPGCSQPIFEEVDQGYTDNVAPWQIHFDFQHPKEVLFLFYERLLNLKDRYLALEREELSKFVENVIYIYI